MPTGFLRIPSSQSSGTPAKDHSVEVKFGNTPSVHTPPTHSPVSRTSVFASLAESDLELKLDLKNPLQAQLMEKRSTTARTLPTQVFGHIQRILMQESTPFTSLTSKRRQLQSLRMVLVEQRVPSSAAIVRLWHSFAALSTRPAW